jgi:hypothetical protein
MFYAHPGWWLICLICSYGAVAAELPKRDLTIEVRQVEDVREEQGGYHVGTQSSAPSITFQKIQVRNGEKGAIHMNASVPFQWVQSAQAASKQSGAGVTHALQWIDAGQNITVVPRWPGSNKPVVVEIDVQQATPVSGNTVELPGQGRSQITTTVTLPLAQWTTFASTGNVPRSGIYSSEGGNEVRQLLQIRALVP